ncbi:MAG: hypothetical protein ACKPKO_13895, partial [Candidatus Fonsibacter sp.]
TSFVDQYNPLPWFRFDRDHVVKVEKYLVLWVKAKMGSECHSLCRKGSVVAKGKVAQRQPPNDMT